MGTLALTVTTDAQIRAEDMSGTAKTLTTGGASGGTLNAGWDNNTGSADLLYEYFFAFPVAASLPSGVFISSAVLSFARLTQGGGANVVEVYAYDWGTEGTITTANWRTNAQLSALTLLASATATDPCTLASTTAFVPAVVAAGATTKLIMVTTAMRTNTAPSPAASAVSQAVDSIGVPSNLRGTLTLTYQLPAMMASD